MLDHSLDEAKTLLESDELLALALHGAEVGAWEFDLVTNENIWHTSMAPIMAVPVERVREEGRQFASYIHPADVERIHAEFRAQVAVPEEGRVWESDFRVIRADGQTRWLTTRGKTVRRAGRLHMIGVAQDITARKEQEHRLRESESRFRLIADSVPAMLWMYDGPRVAFINRAFYEFVGAEPAADPQSFPWYEYMHPEDRERYLADWTRTSAAGLPFQSEMRFRRHDGDFRWTNSVALPRLDSTGQVVGYTGATFDVHEAKAAIASLSEADRRKNEFLAVLAHELRNPLAPVKNAAALMRHLNVEGKVRDAAEMIDRQVGQMVRLIDDLLDVSRITRGRLVLKPELLRLAEICELAIETAKPLIDENRQRLDVSLPAGERLVRGDKVRLAQALVNLLHNAAKFSEPGGVIELHAQAHGEEAHLVVCDRGPGIEVESLPDIFNVSTRTMPDGRHANSGLGLGLGLTRRLVEMHEGRIEARSREDGGGSEFRIMLPLAKG